jgi:hypothetical protein
MNNAVADMQLLAFDKFASMHSEWHIPAEKGGNYLHFVVLLYSNIF